MNKTQLTKFIREYESDTFSSSLRTLTRDEARQVATKLYDWWLAKLEDRIDGVILDQFLCDVRYDKGTKCASCDAERTRPFTIVSIHASENVVCQECAEYETTQKRSLNNAAT